VRGISVVVSDISLTPLSFENLHRVMIISKLAVNRFNWLLHLVQLQLIHPDTQTHGTAFCRCALGQKTTVDSNFEVKKVMCRVKIATFAVMGTH